MGGPRGTFPTEAVRIPWMEEEIPSPRDQSPARERAGRARGNGFYLYMANTRRALGLSRAENGRDWPPGSPREISPDSASTAGRLEQGRKLRRP